MSGGGFGSSPPSTTVAGDLGLIAWTFDPVGGTSASTNLANGQQFLAAVYLRSTVTISKLWWILNSAGVTPTAGQNWGSLYNAAGTLLANAAADSTVTLTGPVSVTLGTPVTVPAGMYWVSVVNNAATPAQLGRSSAAVVGNGTPNQTAANLRFATNATGITTTMPATIVPASNVATGAAFWAAVS